MLIFFLSPHLRGQLCFYLGLFLNHLEPLSASVFSRQFRELGCPVDKLVVGGLGFGKEFVTIFDHTCIILGKLLLALGLFSIK